MTSVPQPPAASPTPVADVLAELTAVLAGMMRIEPQTLDAQEPFRLLGLDSMLSVEFVAALNARYGTRIAATALYEHPTPQALARHVAAELGASRPATPTDTPTPTDTEADVDADVAAAVDADVADVAVEAVTDTLREQLAGILHCGPGEIDVSAPFAALGLDSILAAEFLAGINRTYGLSEQADLLYDQPDLGAMAAYVSARAAHRTPAPGRLGAAFAVPAGQPGPFPAGPAPGGAPVAPAGVDLDALLDAVRDEVLSIDEAAALLAARSA
ncbi:phosphopantetheine-binding protein [Streptomyces mirabilis]|uniref:phosphopantetheine-binding protein n=1 Tax=Streptomyces TaxID=1883 RepID=UPI001164C4F0|nr:MULTISPECIES: phosphopantetheine-binding protein [Streptomyces]MCX4617436.1 phosphopantetheine-binding protein [Streptomyces mirabilis]QDN93201.1 acyl carrier protein [Streptomyces sp. RLB3-6]